jgi:hypothetical protein
LAVVIDILQANERAVSPRLVARVKRAFADHLAFFGVD